MEVDFFPSDDKPDGDHFIDCTPQQRRSLVEKYGTNHTDMFCVKQGIVYLHSHLIVTALEGTFYI